MSISIDKIISNTRDNISTTLSARKISKRFFHGKNSKLYVVTPYWKATLSQWPMRILKKRILKAGNSCLMYQFPIKILSEDIYLTEESFKEIQKEVINDIKEIRMKYNFEEINLIGISLGCVDALMVANKNEDIDKICLVVPGDSISESLWRGIGTVNIKKQIKKHNINLEKLEKKWEELDPKNNISNLDGKEIEIFLSRSDEIIPYKNGYRLVKDMKEIGLKPLIFKNKWLGHYLTIFKFILFKKF